MKYCDKTQRQYPMLDNLSWIISLLDNPSPGQSVSQTIPSLESWQSLCSTISIPDNLSPGPSLYRAICFKMSDGLLLLLLLLYKYRFSTGKDLQFFRHVCKRTNFSKVDLTGFNCRICLGFFRATVIDIFLLFRIVKTIEFVVIVIFVIGITRSGFGFY